MGEVICHPDYLEHHGIKGMKWGIRRYQNEDGSLTSEGRKRYTEIDKNTGFYKNTLDRIDRGTKIGTGIGIATGILTTATAMTALSPAVISAGAALTAMYAVSGYTHGAVVGGLYGMVETKRGQKYIENYDKTHKK